MLLNEKKNSQFWNVSGLYSRSERELLEVMSVQKIMESSFIKRTPTIWLKNKKSCQFSMFLYCQRIWGVGDNAVIRNPEAFPIRTFPKDLIKEKER